jgi:hypothetical protein
MNESELPDTSNVKPEGQPLTLDEIQSGNFPQAQPNPNMSAPEASTYAAAPAEDSKIAEVNDLTGAHPNYIEPNQVNEIANNATRAGAKVWIYTSIAGAVIMLAIIVGIVWYFMQVRPNTAGVVKIGNSGLMVSDDGTLRVDTSKELDGKMTTGLSYVNSDKAFFNEEYLPGTMIHKNVGKFNTGYFYFPISSTVKPTAFLKGGGSSMVKNPDTKSKDYGSLIYFYLGNVMSGTSDFLDNGSVTLKINGKDGQNRGEIRLETQAVASTNYSSENYGVNGVFDTAKQKADAHKNKRMFNVFYLDDSTYCYTDSATTFINSSGSYSETWRCDGYTLGNKSVGPNSNIQGSFKYIMSFNTRIDDTDGTKEKDFIAFNKKFIKEYYKKYVSGKIKYTAE